MTPIGHLAVGFAAKRSGVRVPLGVLLAAAWLLDVLYFLFGFAGIESLANVQSPGTVPSPWSHGMLVSLAWSAGAGLLAWRVYRSRGAGLLIGLVVFSHWLLDLACWETMLLIPGAEMMGLGLFKALGDRYILVELGLFAAGMVVFLAGSDYVKRWRMR